MTDEPEDAPSLAVVDRRRSVVPEPNNLPYVIAVVLMMMAGVAGVVTVSVLRPTADNVALNASILGFLAPTTLSLLAFMKSQETHLSVNSRLDAFMANAKLAAHAQGMIEGRAAEVAAQFSGAAPAVVVAPVLVVPPSTKGN